MFENGDMKLSKWLCHYGIVSSKRLIDCTTWDANPLLQAIDASQKLWFSKPLSNDAISECVPPKFMLKF